MLVSPPPFEEVNAKTSYVFEEFAAIFMKRCMAAHMGAVSQPELPRSVWTVVRANFPAESCDESRAKSRAKSRAESCNGRVRVRGRTLYKQALSATGYSSPILCRHSSGEESVCDEPKERLRRMLRLQWSPPPSLP